MTDCMTDCMTKDTTNVIIYIFGAAANGRNLPVYRVKLNCNFEV